MELQKTWSPAEVGHFVLHQQLALKRLKRIAAWRGWETAASWLLAPRLVREVGPGLPDLERDQWERREIRTVL